MIVTDLVIVTVAFFLAYFVRNSLVEPQPIATYLWFLPLLYSLWGGFLYFSGMYTSFRLTKVPEVLFIIYQSAYLSFFVFAGVCYLFKIAHMSRIFVLLVFFCERSFL